MKTLFAALLLLSGAAFVDRTAAIAQSPRPEVHAIRLTEADTIVLDGTPDEARRPHARTQFSPWISLSNNVQYDSESGTVGWQLRFRWIQKPGNDVFFIWTQNWLDETNRGFLPLDRRGAAKIVRTFRF